MEAARQRFLGFATCVTLPDAMALLHIIDASERAFRNKARREPGVHRLDIWGGAVDLVVALDRLLAQGLSFDRILFQTHGNAGGFVMGGDFIDASWVDAHLQRRGYERLCPAGARVHLNGCNVADGPGGWALLRSLARTFVFLNGGSVFAWNSTGFVSRFAIGEGHIWHLWGSTRTIHMAAGGRIVEEFEQ